jgi:hypothetical protein
MRFCDSSLCNRIARHSVTFTFILRQSYQKSAEGDCLNFEPEFRAEGFGYPVNGGPLCDIFSYMKAIEGTVGRVFGLRLDREDPIPQCIENFAAEKQIHLGHVVFAGGINRGSIVAGPRTAADPCPDPIILPVSEARAPGQRG